MASISMKTKQIVAGLVVALFALTGCKVYVPWPHPYPVGTTQKTNLEPGRWDTVDKKPCSWEIWHNGYKVDWDVTNQVWLSDTAGLTFRSSCAWVWTVPDKGVS